MSEFPEQEFQRLWTTLERLLAPDGCPWDRKQTAADLARYLVEEGQEWRDAVDSGDPAHQAEEIGDLAYLLLFAIQRLQSDEDIPPGEALRLADEKLRRRHPDLFGEAERAGSVEAQTRRWEDIKREERGGEEGLLRPLPRSMGALAKAHRYQDRAATVGFDWPDLKGVLAKLHEEFGELEVELQPWAERKTPPGDGSPSQRFRRELDPKSLDRIRDEVGDLFFVLANLCRWLDMDAEDVAETANEKFLRRFGGMERRLGDKGARLEDSSLEEMEAQWQAFKNEGE